MALGQMSDASGQSESGAVLVTVVIWMAALILMTVFVIDVANWFTHKRHLQMQADAAALAAAGSVVAPCDSAVDTNAINVATKYSGTTTGTGTFNQQIGGTPISKLHMLINSPTYYNQTSPTDTTVVTGTPCTAKMIDVKLTETDLPWYLKKLTVPFINAHARVAIKQVDTLEGALPIAVPEQNAKHVYAQFIDEGNSNAVIDTVELLSDGNAANGDVVYDNLLAPRAVQIDKSQIGVRIVLSNRSDSSTSCTAVLVDCYDANTPNNGLATIRGWTQTGTTPVMKDAAIVDRTCGGVLMSFKTADCALGVSALIDFGTFHSSGLTVTANVDGDKNNSVNLTLNSGRWTGPTTGTKLTIPAGSGPHDINVTWEETSTQDSWNGQACKNGNNNPCKGSWTVQRHFSAVDNRSGPIHGLRVFENGVDKASFPKCSTSTCSHNLVVSISLQPTLKNAQSQSDPLVTLRTGTGGTSGNANQTQALDCDPAISNLKDEIATGCNPQYKVNTGVACPNKTTLWASAQPWNCVANSTGASTNQIPSGLNLRILGDEKPKVCTAPNHWSDWPNLSPADPRIVQVFLTPFGSFAGSGRETVPVTGFATFYITGWTGQGGGFQNPCATAGDTVGSPPENGAIYGHFIKYIQTLNNGSGGSGPCDFSSLASCVAELVE
jgi:hypothetical protein